MSKAQFARAGISRRKNRDDRVCLNIAVSVQQLHHAPPFERLGLTTCVDGPFAEKVSRDEAEAAAVRMI
jgi:hypothetical protein